MANSIGESHATTIDPFIADTRIAYFSMEIALRPEIHTYSGGLGILAGDTARSSADLELPMVFVTLASREGYLRQEIDGKGRQVDHPDPWNPEKHAVPLPAMAAVQIEGRRVWIRPWLYVLTCPTEHRIPVILLDTDVAGNEARDRSITARLYGGDQVHRLMQEIVLGIGGERVLQALGFRISTFHLNEGHAALLTVSLLRQHRRASGYPGSAKLYDPDPVRDQCVFTTHTPVEAGHDQFEYALSERLLGDFIETETLKLFAGTERLNMTRLALNLSGYVNGVARRHAETTSRMFPGYRIRAVTNGVHVPTWTHLAFAELFQGIAPNWGHEPEILARADQLSDAEIWAAHTRAKGELLQVVNDRTGVSLDRDLPIIGFARRMTGYKRPELLFSDLDRLRTMAEDKPFQIILAGKAHPQDGGGKTAIEQIHRHLAQLAGSVAGVFLPNYDFALARHLICGVDVWLNTPVPPLEASGTSGMKAALNGVLNLSVLDGWWVEAWIEGVTGWAIGADGDQPDRHADALYEQLENKILPLYARNRPQWIWMMKESISKVGSQFTSQRMMRRYASEAYLR
ncbi:alpha-glucan family phosphorylase [Pseudorhizobium flavum]|uniref:glycogen phosphorylase n=1 Tax=Pseudorhizobium flavum TaxID=1335061 RepID=A0A7W9Z4S0_9HYPH|nr:alpha-glucan family phosphorylase [Pseudorhizobium flavum]MBB6182501.1 starch phosphorylase [Pseudorhizobium flavum]CAD6630877.1 alpha-glucan family phosphorylase [Pseudorhizobium flavum]